MDLILPDIVSIGIYNSQIAVKNTSFTKKRKTTMFEIEMPIEKGGISCIDSESMQIVPDMIICAKPGQTRHTRLPYKCYYIHIILKEGMLYDALMNIPVFVTLTNTENYIRIFNRLCKHYDSSLDGNDIIIHSLILELVHTLTNDSNKQLYKQNFPSGNYEAVNSAIGYIKKNLTGDLSLSAVAEYANLSPIHFHNCFKSATGETLHDYVQKQRIKRACNLLITTDSTITAIAYECGFSSQSYFSYAFKRETGLTPREYATKVFQRYNL